MIALLDGDILVYRVAFTTETEDVSIAQWRMNELINTIVATTGATEYKVFLTGSNDPTAFRKILYPDYKGNRKAPRPLHYQAMREFLVSEHGASISTTIEADDALGISLLSDPDNSILVSIDKDLLQIPGKHYNFVKQEFKTVTPYEGLRFFYYQCLVGDAADNIKGVKGCGKVGANSLLTDAEAEVRDNYSCFDEPPLDELEDAWFNAVRGKYNDDLEFSKNGNCLWMMRTSYPLGIYNYHRLGKLLLPEMEDEQLCSQRVVESILDATSTTT
jgi:5'-3' exonuclease